MNSDKYNWNLEDIVITMPRRERPIVKKPVKKPGDKK